MWDPIQVKLLTLVYDHLLQLPLGRRPLQDLLVDGVGCDQAVHQHRFGLTDAVATVLGLQVCLGVLRGARREVSAQTDSTQETLGPAFIIFAPTQSLSKMMTVSAAVRLIPSPPALVLNRKRNTSGSSENLAI